ncbi:MAG TPA: alpha/beta hydrolase family protein [Candidatus Acidoferrales bacterium]|nr:alpha/beta hydrolase family protein [Candidatus Acidoferrales bacterium]
MADLWEVGSDDLPAAGWADWLLTWLGAGLDDAALQAMSIVVDRFVMPQPDAVDLLRQSAAAFRRGELWEEPRKYFSFIDAAPAPRSLTSWHRGPRSGGVITDHRMDTGYVSFATGAAVPSADALHFQHWTHEGEPPRATVVALHGFSMGYPRIDSFAMFAPAIFAEGYDVALVTLPFHGARTPPDARFSGERFAVPHVAQLNEAVRQAIFELHLLVDWLRQHSGAPVGLLGLSLGGYLSALMAGLRSDLAFVIPMVPPVCMGDLAWRFFTRSRVHRDVGAEAFSRDELRAAFRVHSPLTYECRVDLRRLLILAGRGDRIVPPDHPHRLWKHWNEPEIHWFGGSHLAPFRRSNLQARILQHLDACTD